MSTQAADPSRMLVKMLLKDLGLVLGLLYAGSWLYLNRYYAAFQIDLAMLELGWHEILIHSAALIRDTFRWAFQGPQLVCFLAPVVALAWCHNYGGPSLAGIARVLGPVNMRLMLPIAGIVIALFVFTRAVEVVAHEAAARDWTSIDQPIRFDLRAECLSREAPLGQQLAEPNEAGRLRLVKATPKWYFVVDPPLRRTAATPMRAFHVPVTCVRNARLELPAIEN